MLTFTLLIVVGGVLLSYKQGQTLLAKTIISALSNDGSLTFEDVEISLNGKTVITSPTYTLGEGQVIEAEELILDFRMGYLLLKQIVVSNVEIKRPRVKLLVDTASSTSFSLQDILDLIREREEFENTLSFDRIQIESGSLLLHNKASGEPLPQYHSFENIDVYATDIHMSDQGIVSAMIERLSTQIDDTLMVHSLKGEIAPSENQYQQVGKISVQTEASSVELDVFFDLATHSSDTARFDIKHLNGRLATSEIDFILGTPTNIPYPYLSLNASGKGDNQSIVLNVKNINIGGHILSFVLEMYEHNHFQNLDLDFKNISYTSSLSTIQSLLGSDKTPPHLANNKEEQKISLQGRMHYSNQQASGQWIIDYDTYSILNDFSVKVRDSTLDFSGNIRSITTTEDIFPWLHIEGVSGMYTGQWGDQKDLSVHAELFAKKASVDKVDVSNTSLYMNLNNGRMEIQTSTRNPNVSLSTSHTLEEIAGVYDMYSKVNIRHIHLSDLLQTDSMSRGRGVIRTRTNFDKDKLYYLQSDISNLIVSSGSKESELEQGQIQYSTNNDSSRFALILGDDLRAEVGSNIEIADWIDYLDKNILLSLLSPPMSHFPTFGDNLSDKAVLDIQINVEDGRWLHILYPRAQIETPSAIELHVNSDNTTLQAIIPQFRYDAYTLDDVEANLSFPVHETDTAEYLSVRNLMIDELQMDSIRLSLSAESDSIINIDIEGRTSIKNKPLSFAIHSNYTTPTRNRLQFAIHPSTITYGDEEWILHHSDEGQTERDVSRGFVQLTDGSFDLGNIALVSGDQETLFRWGENKEMNESLLTIRAAALDLSTFTDGAIEKGRLYIEYVSRESEEREQFGKIYIDSLHALGSDFGEVTSVLRWIEDENIFNINTSFTKNNNQYGTIEGWAVQQGNDWEIDNLDIQLNDLSNSLYGQIVAPDVLRDFSGTSSLSVQLSGTLNKPELDGTLTLSPRSGFYVPAVNLDFRFNDQTDVRIENDSITFYNVTFEEQTKKTTGLISGELTNYLEDLYSSFSIRTDRTLSMDLYKSDTTASAYYGRAYTTGELELFGTSETYHIHINDIEAVDSTVLHIPIYTINSSISGFDYVSFGSLSPNSLASTSTSTTSSGSSVLVKFNNLEITPSSDIYVYFNQAGDNYALAHASGVISMESSPSGFLLYGRLGIESGTYQMKIANVLTKRFEIDPKSSIVWDGSPLNPTMDVFAIHRLRASLAPILEDPSYNYNSDVLLNIHAYDKPSQLKNDISIAIPNESPDAQLKLDNALLDPSELNRQFLSLVASNTFFPTTTSQLQTSTTSANGNATGTANLLNAFTLLTSNALINELSNTVTSANSSNVDIGLSYKNQTSPLTAIDEQVEVNLSGNFLNNRITVNGLVGIPVGQSQSSFVGDVEIEYNIFEDRSARLKAFNKQNRLFGVQTQQGFLQGVGIYYLFDFDEEKD